MITTQISFLIVVFKNLLLSCNNTTSKNSETLLGRHEFKLFPATYDQDSSPVVALRDPLAEKKKNKEEN